MSYYRPSSSYPAPAYPQRPPRPMENGNNNRSILPPPRDPPPPGTTPDDQYYPLETANFNVPPPILVPVRPSSVPPRQSAVASDANSQPSRYHSSVPQQYYSGQHSSSRYYGTSGSRASERRETPVPEVYSEHSRKDSYRSRSSPPPADYYRSGRSYSVPTRDHERRPKSRERDRSSRSSTRTEPTRKAESSSTDSKERPARISRFKVVMFHNFPMYTYHSLR